MSYTPNASFQPLSPPPQPSSGCEPAPRPRITPSIGGSRKPGGRGRGRQKKKESKNGSSSFERYGLDRIIRSGRMRVNQGRGSEPWNGHE